MQLARVLLVGVGFAAACSGNRGATTLDNKAASARAASLAASDPLAFLPVDSEVVVGVDFRQITQSALWTRFGGDLMKRAGGGLQEFKAKCGYDPIASMRNAAFSIKMEADKPSGVFVVRGIDRDKTMACIPQSFPDRPAKVDGAFVTFPPEDGIATVLTFVDASTAVAVIGPQASRVQLEAAIAAGAPLRKSPAFGALWSHADAKQTVWVVVNGKLLAVLAALGAPPKALVANVSLANGLTLAGRLQFASPDQATQVATAMQSQATAAQAFVEKIDISAAGNDVSLGVRMTMPQLEGLFGMLSPFGP